MNITNETIGGEEIITKYEVLLSARKRRQLGRFGQAWGSMIEVTKDGKLIDWSVFNWKEETALDTPPTI